MSGEKPAPTAAEVAAARYWFSGADPLREPSMGPTTRVHVAVLLAALDAAEARATAAETELRERSGADVSIRYRLATAERERDELRDALKLYEAFPELATGDTARRDEQRAAYNGLRWVLGLLAGLDDGRQDSVAKAFRPVVEKIKRERDEARAALKPFASFSAGMSRMVPSSTEVLYIDGSKAGLTAGDFRAAAAALKEAPRG